MEQKEQKKQTHSLWKILIILLVVTANLIAGISLYKSWQSENAMNAMNVIPSQTAETAKTVSSSESAQTDVLKANLTVVSSEGNLTFTNPKIPLQDKSGNTIVVGLPDGSYSMKLDTQSGYAEIYTSAGTIKIITSDADKDSPKSLYKLRSEDGQTILAGTVCVGADKVTVQGIPSTEENISEVSDICAYILDNTATAAEGASVYIAGVEVPENWTNHVVCSENSISIGNGQETISAAPYDKTPQDAGFTQQENVDVFGTVYSGKVADADTGEKPYLYQANDGTTWIMVITNN